MTLAEFIPKKILVIRFSSLGDIILSFPLLRKLRRQFPGAKIDYLTKAGFADAVELIGIADEILTPESGLKALRKEIGNRSYDIILDIHKNLRSVYVSAFNADKIKRVKKDHFRKFLLVNGGINLFDEIVPVYRKYILASKTYIPALSEDFETSHLKFTEFKVPADKFIVIAPCSKHFTKTYPQDKFVKFINSLQNIRAVLVGSDSNEDKDICSRIESECSGVTNLCGMIDLKELVYLIMKSELVVSNDSAVMHLSEALGKKVTAIFGSTVKEFGFYPQLETSVVLEQKGLSCRPCSHIGLRECPVLNFRCMRLTALNSEDLELT